LFFCLSLLGKEIFLTIERVKFNFELQITLQSKNNEKENRESAKRKEGGK
jgi:hypothetical protein